MGTMFNTCLSWKIFHFTNMYEFRTPQKKIIMIVNEYIYIYTYIYIYIYVFIYIYVYIYVYIYICMYICIYIYIRGLSI